MKKTLLVICALFLATSTFAIRYELPLANLGTSGWGDVISDGNGTLTYVDAWTGCGWWLAPEDVPTDFSAYTKVVVNFNELPFPVRIVIQYSNDTPNTQFDVPAGATKGEANLNPEGAMGVTQIYLQSGNGGVGTIVVTEAYITDEADTPLVPSTIIDFETDEVDTTYPSVAWSASDVSAIVVANPAGDGKSLHVIGTNWNAYPKFTVALPDGKTIADIKKIQFDVYFSANESDQNNWKNFDYFIGAQGTSFTPNNATGSATNIIGESASNPTTTWLSKEFELTIEDPTLSALNIFDFGFGLLFNNADYYLDNIGFVLNETGIIYVDPLTSPVRNVEGGILVNANEKVSVYGIDGRLVKQTVANHNMISLNQGIYIVKVGTAQPVKVLIK